MAENDFGIAIIGMAGRFPQADTVQAFWENLLASRECISFTAMRNCWRWESVLNLFSTQITSRPKGR